MIWICTSSPALAAEYFNPLSWTHVYTGVSTGTPGANQFYCFDNANSDPMCGLKIPFWMEAANSCVVIGIILNLPFLLFTGGGLFRTAW